MNQNSKPEKENTKAELSIVSNSDTVV